MNMKKNRNLIKPSAFIMGLVVITSVIDNTIGESPMTLQFDDSRCQQTSTITFKLNSLISRNKLASQVITYFGKLEVQRTFKLRY